MVHWEGESHRLLFASSTWSHVRKSQLSSWPRPPRASRLSFTILGLGFRNLKWQAPCGFRNGHSHTRVSSLQQLHRVTAKELGSHLFSSFLCLCMCICVCPCVCVCRAWFRKKSCSLSTYYTEKHTIFFVLYFSVSLYIFVSYQSFSF